METLDLKETLHHIADELPANASVYNALERLYLLTKVETALSQVEHGETILHAEIQVKVSSWQK